MPRITDTSDDLKTLIGEQYPADYIHQEQERELAALLAEGYGEWADELQRELDEQAAWQGAKEFNGVLKKKACEHTSCPHFSCERGLRIGGIEI
jgi:hypothetical protein